MSTTFISAATGWVLGTAPCASSPCTSIVRTRDGGRTWAGLPTPRASLGNPSSGREGQVAVIRFADAADGWLGVGGLYSTHDGGSHWTQLAVPGGRGVVSSIETGGGYVYVTVDGCPSQGGNNCSFTSALFAAPIGSDHFVAVGQPVRGGLGPSGLVVHGSDWFLPSVSGIYYGHGESSLGVRPEPCPAGRYGPAHPALAAGDADHLDAVCSFDGGDGSITYQIYGTSDGGQQWIKTGPPHRESSNLTGVADNGHGVLLLSVASGGSQILRSTDDGGTLTMSRANAPSGGYSWADLGFTTSTQAVVVLDGHGLYLSHDAGASFTPVTFG